MLERANHIHRRSYSIFFYLVRKHLSPNKATSHDLLDLPMYYLILKLELNK